MNDPSVTLLALVSGANWTLTGNLAAANIRFCTGWIDQDFPSDKNAVVTITEISDVDRNFELGYGIVRVDAVYQIDVWVKIKSASSKGPGKAKEWLWDLHEMIKSILRNNLAGNSGIEEVVLNDVGRRLDEPEHGLLRYSKRFGVLYNI